MNNTKENTPKHCHDCWKLADCDQAQNMVAGTEPVSGYTDADMYDYFCDDCLPDDSGGMPMDFDEADSPCHCSVCGVPLEHSLTEVGVKYITEKMANDDMGCCQELWPTVWKDYL